MDAGNGLAAGTSSASLIVEAPGAYVEVNVRGTSSAALLINVPMMHGTNWGRIAIGGSSVIQVPAGGEMNVKGDGGTATIDWHEVRQLGL